MTAESRPTNGSVAIVGGGFTGLTAAYRLSAAGHTVTLFEQGDDLGGLAGGFTMGGQPLEKAYHFLYRTDEHMWGLLDELEMRDLVHFHDSSLSTYYDGVLYPMMTPLDLIRFKPLSFVDRIRAGVTVLYLQRVRKWEKLTHVTALSWLRKWAGPRVTDVVWEPLLRGKFDHYYDKVTMGWLWGRVKQRADSQDRGENTEKLGYFTGGFRVLVDELVSRTEAAGGTVRTGATIDSVGHDPDTGLVEINHGGTTETFDKALLTVPSTVAGRLLADYHRADPDYFAKLEAIDYLAAAVLVFMSEQQITPYYWHNINEPDSPFVVFLSLTNLVGTDDFDGRHVYYIGDYVPDEHAYMAMSPDKLKEHWYTQMGRIFPDFDRDQIVEDELFRFRDSQHIVDVGYEDKLVPHQTPCPGVWLANFSQIYPMDRGTNYAVRDGIDLAEEISRTFSD
ncbi:MAG: NAD(P)/FAD-dependent oxidoreductase [Actinomycetia bacterium]|nr:NAD(P)/FAD-dependent oxidoreductase [Actinomycetes bacterium]